jgi:Ca2+-binding EF-hand superfamily protein
MKNSNRLMLLGGVLGLVLAASAPVLAQMSPWAQADSNGDGAIDRAEFDAQRANHFKSTDSDGDGFVTEAELKAFFEAKRAQMEAHRGDKAAKMMERLDANKDGKITEAEWPKEGRMSFKNADADSDGAVTAEELTKMRKMHGGKDHMARVDADKDGKISTAEWNAQADKMFARLDDNKDGKIDKDEMPRHHKRKQQGGGQPVQP